MQYYKIVRNDEKKYGSRAMVGTVVTALFFLIIGKKDVCQGLVLGGIFSILNFVLISQSLYSRLKRTKRRAIMSAGASIVLRYTNMAFPLVIAIKFQKFDLLGTAIGLFAIQLAILTERLPRFFSPHKH